MFAITAQEDLWEHCPSRTTTETNLSGQHGSFLHRSLISLPLVSMNAVDNLETDRRFVFFSGKKNRSRSIRAKTLSDIESPPIFPLSVVLQDARSARKVHFPSFSSLLFSSRSSLLFSIFSIFSSLLDLLDLLFSSRSSRFSLLFSIFSIFSSRSFRSSLRRFECQKVTKGNETGSLW